MRRLFLLTALFLIALSNVARASVSISEAEIYYSNALTWWSVSSPPQCTTVNLLFEDHDPVNEAVAARATQPLSGERLTCKIVIFENIWNRESSCAREMIVRHETGHLLGLDHSTDPNSIMAPIFNHELWCPSEAIASSETESVLLEWPTESQELFKAWHSRLKLCHHYQNQKKIQNCWAWARHIHSEYVTAKHREA